MSKLAHDANIEFVYYCTMNAIIMVVYRKYYVDKQCGNVVETLCRLI